MTVEERLWAALCEMKESEGVVLKDQFCERVREILASRPTDIVMQTPAERRRAKPLPTMTVEDVGYGGGQGRTMLWADSIYQWDAERVLWVWRR